MKSVNLENPCFFRNGIGILINFDTKVSNMGNSKAVILISIL